MISQVDFAIVVPVGIVKERNPHGEIGTTSEEDEAEYGKDLQMCQSDFSYFLELIVVHF